MGSNTDMKPVDDDSEEKVFISTENDDSIPVWAERFQIQIFHTVSSLIICMLSR